MLSAAHKVALALCTFLVCLGAAAQPAHERFDRALRRHVGNGSVDYPAIATDADFRAYVASLAEPVVLPSGAERLAYYVNAYNALAIQGILDGLSPATLFGRARFFKLRRWRLNGREINLYDLERDVLVPLREARIHFSIVCASKSCPRLRAEAYTAEGLQHQLDESARAFVNDPGRNRFERERRIARLSEIFKWYEEDFSRDAGSLQKYLAKYVNDPDTAKDLAAERYAIEWIAYDWSLNGTRLDR